MATIKGVVAWFNPEKGFGFITPDDAPPDADPLFVHCSGIAARAKSEMDEQRPTLGEGEEVEYTIGYHHKTGKAQAETVTGPGGSEVIGAGDWRADKASGKRKWGHEPPRDTLRANKAACTARHARKSQTQLLQEYANRMGIGEAISANKGHRPLDTTYDPPDGPGPHRATIRLEDIEATGL